MKPSSSALKIPEFFDQLPLPQHAFLSVVRSSQIFLRNSEEEMNENKELRLNIMTVREFPILS